MRFLHGCVSRLLLFTCAYGVAAHAQTSVDLGVVIQSGVDRGVVLDVRKASMLDPINQGGGFAYGPSIVKDGDYYHMFFCSAGRLDMSTGNPADGYEWDFIRHSVSRDGLTWTSPEIVLKPAPRGPGSERSACDPSVVKFKGEWYMYYGGNADRYAGGIYVAKAASLWGKFQKWTGSGWVENGVPKLIIAPKCPYATCLPATDILRYGAGQPTAVVKDGIVHLWYHDDTRTKEPHRRNYYSTSADGVTFSAGNQIFIDGSKDQIATKQVGDMYYATELANDDFPNTDNGEVKWDPLSNKFWMFQQRTFCPFIGVTPYPELKQVFGDLVRKLCLYSSVDGLNWVSRNKVVSSNPTIPLYASNIGVSADAQGWIDAAGFWVSMGVPWTDMPPQLYQQNMATISYGSKPMKKIPLALPFLGDE
ncbi:MAG: hypothetical protein IPK50_00865 [Fibrobacterota bacterium]|nr:MAG: hypothetical protein IPK50_00865 [Fibrobacterota bacterium]